MFSKSLNLWWFPLLLLLPIFVKETRSYVQYCVFTVLFNMFLHVYFQKTDSEIQSWSDGGLRVVVYQEQFMGGTVYVHPVPLHHVVTIWWWWWWFVTLSLFKVFRCCEHDSFIIKFSIKFLSHVFYLPLMVKMPASII